MTLARCLIAVLLFSLLSSATARAERATGGIEAGVNGSGIAASGSDEHTSMLMGAPVGFYVVIPILKSLSFEPEVLYVQRYTKRSFGITRSDARIEYVELPLLAKMPFLWGTYFTEGVTLGFPVNETGVAPNLTQVTSPDVAIVIGGGYNVAKYFALEFRYDSSLRRLSTVPTAPVERGRDQCVARRRSFPRWRATRAPRYASGAVISKL